MECAVKVNCSRPFENEFPCARVQLQRPWLINNTAEIGMYRLGSVDNDLIIGLQICLCLPACFLFICFFMKVSFYYLSLSLPLQWTQQLSLSFVHRFAVPDTVYAVPATLHSWGLNNLINDVLKCKLCWIGILVTCTSKSIQMKWPFFPSLESAILKWRCVIRSSR